MEGISKATRELAYHAHVTKLPILWSYPCPLFGHQDALSKHPVSDWMEHQKQSLINMKHMYSTQTRTLVQKASA